MKKLVIAFSKKNKSGKPFEYLDYPYMYDIYYKLFDLFLENGLETYICRDINNFLSNKDFLTMAKYQKGNGFVLSNEKVSADIVWDRTSLYSFPLPQNKLNVDILNTMEFKLISDDKWLSYLNYRDYFPKTVLFVDPEQIQEYIDQIPSEKFVIKPIMEFGGKAVESFHKSDLDGINKYLSEQRVEPRRFILQEFCDVKSGIKGFVEGVHDMRIVSTNNKIIFSYIRKPTNPNEFRANFAVGGTMEEVDPKNLPSDIVDFVKPIIKDAYENYSNPFFSIDIFMTKSGPKVIEITGSALGFPMPDMNIDQFFGHLVERFTK